MVVVEVAFITRHLYKFALYTLHIRPLHNFFCKKWELKRNLPRINIECRCRWPQKSQKTRKIIDINIFITFRLLGTNMTLMIHVTYKFRSESLSHFLISCCPTFSTCFCFCKMGITISLLNWFGTPKSILQRKWEFNMISFDLQYFSFC